jgi:hypothetical protein
VGWVPLEVVVEKCGALSRWGIGNARAQSKAYLPGFPFH